MNKAKKLAAACTTQKEQIPAVPDNVPGWNIEPLGQYRSGGINKAISDFMLLTRTRNLSSVIDDLHKKSSSPEPAKPHKDGVSGAGSNTTMGSPKRDMTPSESHDVAHIGTDAVGESAPPAPVEGGNKLPELADFLEYKSLESIRSKTPCLLIGYDSEWQDAEIRADIISWQFALVDGLELREFVFLRAGSRDLSLDLALGCILDRLGSYRPVDVRCIRRYQFCSGWSGGRPCLITTNNHKEAMHGAKYVYRPGVGFTHELIEDMPDKGLNRSRRDWAWFHSCLDYKDVDPVSVCLVCHFGRVDVSSLSEPDMLRHLTEVQDGLVSLRPVRITITSHQSVSNKKVYPVLLSVRDTMCHAPADKKSLDHLGDVINVPKLHLADDPKKEDEIKSNMRGLLRDNPVLFMDYASRDSVVTMLYASALYGYNRLPAVTITSAGANVMRRVMMNYLGCKNTQEFDSVYRGLNTVKHGLYAREDRPGFVEATSLEPISNDANTVQYFSAQAYHGGYNGCFEVGAFLRLTLDYDLQNAYPTAMCLVPDIDWDHPIRSEVIREELTLDHFAGSGGINPVTSFIGYVRFEFPDNVKYPCIPISVDGVPAYPRTSKGLDGVYAAGPYIWLALKLGAKVFCERGYFLSVRHLPGTTKPSMSLAAAVKQFVKDRTCAKKLKGKGSLEELILKVLVNAGYGKVAQNVIEKSTWSAYKDMMESLGCSGITNPVSAMMITSIVQVELLAAQNQIHGLKGTPRMSCSVTTDGFISDCSFNVLKGLDLYGLRPVMEEARLFLTDGKDPEIWEPKHAQDDLINFTTRGNVSLHWYKKEKDGTVTGNPMWIIGEPYNGVCAHNSTKSGYPSDSYEDRLWLMKQVLSRTGPVEYSKMEFTTFKDLVKGKPFSRVNRTRHVRMDFDMKRKPVRHSFKTDKVSLDGVEYELAHFDTEPFDSVEEFRLYRAKKELCGVLRTVADWDVFWAKLAVKDTKAKPRDMDWAILNSCIMGHRAGHWTIPGLAGKSVDDKCSWINSHNTSVRKFKPSDWKNARKPERQVNMLPKELIQDKLQELMEALS